MDEQIQVRDVLIDAWKIARKLARNGLIVAMLLTVSFTGTDVLLTETIQLGVQWVLTFVMLYVQLYITGVALSEANLAGYEYDARSPTRGRFASAFGQTIIYTFGVIAGLALLIVPGLILLVRWSVCLPALLAEDLTIGESLKRSWDLTSRNWTPIGIVELIIVLLWVVPAGFLIMLYPDFDAPNVSTAFFVNGLMSFTAVAAWFVTVALYAHLVQHDVARKQFAEALPSAAA